MKAAKRFQALDAWRSFPAREIQTNAGTIRLDDAQEVIARESGFTNWAQLAAETAGAPIVFHTARLFPEKSDVFLNLWFRSYEDARAAHEAEPDLLLFPYGEQFVLCEPALLGWLGADPHDPDWEKIGRDWVQALDEAARSRLAARLHKALR
ncbi:MAG TPA: hypothetical protein VG168_10460 [Bryobacteraceae bacterium]|nr:hypothetical protein [Bryobacteraceae bacterium]